MSIKVNQGRTLQLESVRKVVRDISLLIGSALLLAGLGVGTFAMGIKYHIAYTWIWAVWFGVFSFSVMLWSSLRSKFRRRGFIVFSTGWFLIHMLVMFEAATRLPMLISMLPVVFELWIGLAVCFWVFGLPPAVKK